MFVYRNDLIIDIDAFVFTTEAHLLPLTLARLSNRTVVPVSELDMSRSLEFFTLRVKCRVSPMLVSRHNTRFCTTKTVSILDSILEYRILIKSCPLPLQLPEGQSDPPIDEDVEYDRSCPSINFLFPHEEGSRVSKME